MKSCSRMMLVGALFAAATAIGSAIVTAAPTGQFSPLKSVVAETGGALETVDHRWGRRCYRDCYVGRHGRLYCTWRCYRPRRWW